MNACIHDNLDPFQEFVRDKALEHDHWIIADQMGLGKTRTTLSVIDKAECQNILVVCTKNAFIAWKTQCNEWLPDVEVIYCRGTNYKIKERHAAWAYAQQRVKHDARPGICMFITTPATFLNDRERIPRNWDALILDEYDRFMSNRSQTWKALKKLQVKKILPVSGTPTRKGPQNWWPILNLMHPKRFTSYWRFVEEYTYVSQGYFGREIKGIKNEEDLRELLRNYMSRHLKKDVAKDLPAKIRERLPVEMEPKQARVYKQLKQDLMTMLKDELYMVENKLELMIRIRQLLCCPQILDPTLPDGGGLETIIDRMHTDSAHSVIFVPFIDGIPFIKARLEKEGFGPVIVLQGGLDPDELSKRISIFKEQEGVCICSIRYSQSFELDTCQYAYFLGFEWDPDTNEQAEDRLHRMHVRHVVNVWYIIHAGTIDNHVMEEVNEKHRNIEKMLRDPNSLQRILEAA